MTFRLIAAAAALGAIVGCDSKNPTSPSPGPSPATSCSYAVSGAPTAPVDADGRDFTVNVSAAAGCAWSASSSAPFITINGAASGSGSGAVRFNVQSNGGAARQGSITIATTTLTIQQSAAGPQTCEFSVSPTSATLPIDGGDRTIAITARSGVDCPWTSASHSPFITIKSGASGTGSGSTEFTIAANPGEARVGTATVAGREVAILQDGAAAAACAFSVSPTQASMPAAGGSVIVAITKTSGGTCPWIVQSPGPFISTVGPTSGVGDGTVSVFIAPNPGPGARSDTVIVAGHLVTLSQPAPVVTCMFDISPMQITIFSSGGTPQIAVTNTQGVNCPWTAVSNDLWITITSGSSGQGGGNVRISVAPNPGPPRTGTLTIAGKTVTISQNTATPCAFSVTPLTHSSPSGGSSFGLSVVQTSGEVCTWTAQSNAAWIYWLNGPVLTGYGTSMNNMTLVGANPTAAPRTGTIDVAGSVVTVTQAPGLPSTAAFVINYQSDQGDSVGQGQSGTATFVGGSQFLVSYNPSFGELSIGTTPGTEPAVSVRLSAPAGQQLAPGLYENGYSMPVPQPSLPGIAVAMFHNACGTGHGRFIISEFEVTNGNVTRLHASFQQHCNFTSPGLRGSIWIDAAGSTSPPAPPVLVTPATPTTFFNYVSQPMDVLGSGLTGSYELATATFLARYNPGEVQVRVFTQTASFDRTIYFRTGGGTPPNVGTYDPGQFQLIGWGACSSVSGKFTILEATYGPSGVVKRFRATFEIHCGSATAALTGEVYIVADPWR